LTGPLNCDGNFITYFHEPTEKHHAVTKFYCDGQITKSKTDILSAVDAIVNDRIQNHDIILDREIRTKSWDLNPEGVATKDFSMRGKYHIVRLPDAQLDHGAVNLLTMNTKIQSEIEINEQLE